jgi:hypothetical protein
MTMMFTIDTATCKLLAESIIQMYLFQNAHSLYSHKTDRGVLEQLIVSGAGGSGFDFPRPSALKTRLVLNWSDADARPSLAHLFSHSDTHSIQTNQRGSPNRVFSEFPST